jgi:hypothetical protein
LAWIVLRAAGEAAMERIGTLLPTGGQDPQVHRGARRRHRRYPLNAEVTFLAPAGARGVTLNASSGGLRVAVDQDVTVGDLCAVDVLFPGGRRSLEHCRVVWSQQHPDGFVMGLEFIDVH